MLKIGDFSKLTQVSVRSLRHYDKLGLLKPAFINKETNHRYYTLDQLECLNRIVALKNLGFTLQQVSYLLEADLSPNDIHKMLKHKQLELQRSVEAQQHSLAEVDFRLKQMGQKGEMPDCDVVMKTVPSYQVMSAFQIPANGHKIADFMYDLYHTLRTHNIEVENAIGLFHGVEDARQINRQTHSDLPFGSKQLEGSFVTECTTQPIPFRNGLIRSKTLATLPKVASLIYKGPLRLRGNAILSLLKWLDYSHHLLLGPIREVYHRVEPSTEDPENLVEIQFPVKAINQENLSLN